MTTNELDFLGLGEGLNELAVETGGFRKVQHMNPNHTYHAKTLIADGGYAIKNEIGDAPALKGGKTQTIKHQGGNSTVMMCAPTIDVALIGWTNKYYVAEYDDPVDAGKRVVNYVAEYIAPQDLPGAKGKCRSSVTLFIVLKDDPERQLWAIDFRGYCADDAQKLIFSAKALANELGRKAGAKTVHPFAHWLTLGLGEAKMVGKVEQSLVAPPAWVKDGESIARTVVTKDEYAHFIELRRELDEYLPQSRYAVKTFAPALNAPASRPALGAPSNGYRPMAEGEDFNG